MVKVSLYIGNPFRRCKTKVNKAGRKTMFAGFPGRGKTLLTVNCPPSPFKPCINE